MKRERKIKLRIFNLVTEIVYVYNTVSHFSFSNIWRLADQKGRD